jgi:dTDP-4-amino-4,6-dideoxygalactose transaminase
MSDNEIITKSESSDWQVPTGSRHSYQSYMVWLTNDAPITRDQLMQGLLDRGISTRRGIMAIHGEAPLSRRLGLAAAEHEYCDGLGDHSVVLSRDAGRRTGLGY